MRILVVLVCFFSTTSAAAQDQRVLLRWQVAPDSALAFRTVMRAAETKPDSGLAASMPSAERADYTTVLRALRDENIGVEVIHGDIEFADDSTTALYESIQRLQKELGSTQLRGEINARGEITSFWLPQQQKNLLALFFEMPADSVSVGDVWSLGGASLLFLSGPFKVTDSARKNEVRLVELEISTVGPIAMLEYDLMERVSGDFGHMEFAFRGRGSLTSRRERGNVLEGA